jgi:hypothetical protein
MIGNCHLVRNESVVTDGKTPVDGKNSANERAIVSNFHAPFDIKVEKGPVVNASVMADSNTDGQFTTIMKERKRTINPTSRPNLHVSRQRSRKPIVRQ